MGNGETVEPSLIFVENVEEWDLLEASRWVYGHTKCFLTVNQLSKVNVITARGLCNGLDAVAMGSGEMVEPSLLFIESVEEYSLLQPHLNADWVWMNCENVGTTWKCYTDREGTTSDYRNWDTNQPQERDDEKCVVIISGGRMHDHFCTKSGTTVCQINI
eukprot:XP_011668579.1 PREDICTED: uncharacterized protein LOC105440300 [Strongylocentrotus purpuratus]